MALVQKPGIRHRVVGSRIYYWSVGPDAIDQQADPKKDVVFVLIR